MTPGLRLRHLAFLGPHREAAMVSFGPGLNVIYGASETGKSFIVEAIDFMLGGRPPLRDIPERIGYDRILMGVETLDGGTFTLQRSVDGGRFRVFSELHFASPAEVGGAQELSEVHSDRSTDNLSTFLLEKCQLAHKRLRRNKRGDTNSLSFRHLARLVIVTETEITEQRSPLKDGNPTADTPNFATFKLLLTGVDDSALVASAVTTPEDQTREAQAQLLDQLIEEYRERLKEIAARPKELEDQLARIEGSLQQQTEQLSVTESEYRSAAGKRRELREKLEEGRDRQAETASLLERFTLLGRHYDSDIERLRGIEEAGTLFVALGQAVCPLCGAEPAHHRHDSDCDGNVDAVVAAARSELAKINLLRTELDETVTNLRREHTAFDRSLPRVENQLRQISTTLEERFSPRLTRLRSSYKELADKRGEVREALVMLRTLQDAEQRRIDLDKQPAEQNGSSIADGDLPIAIAEKFAQEVEAILKQWHFPDANRVYFESKARDLVIDGKLRTARGKGLRAITHAAFTFGLLQYCRANNTPHPGFVILDSPLLAYRAPEGDEVDLTGTDLNEQFYAHLASLTPDKQVIIVENTDPPDTVTSHPQAIMFSKNPHSGRYGFFPLQGDQLDLEAPETE
jgi:hypothetical protein